MPKSPIVQTIKKVMPSVVSILISKHFQEIEKKVPIEGFRLPFKLPKLKIPKEQIDGQGMVNVGGGSGFFVDKKGIIITNKHIIIDPKAEYTIITNDNKKFKAKILARDPINDVAILKIADSQRNFPTVKLGDSSKLELGESVIAIGNALGLFKNTVSVGIISGLSRSIAAQLDSKSPIQEMRGLIQTDAAINPGNSGGPLVNIKCEVIGINAATVFGAENIGFALPINEVKRDLDELKKYGRIRRPFLGIRYIIINANIKDKLKLSVDYGALLISENPHDQAVISKSPASQAGIKEGDIILECNSKKIDQNKTIQDFLETLEVGDILKLKILRGKKEFEVKVKLAERK
ncbi:MAG: trypsin-like peptidase domain-containing protein [Candidatus Paceibacterota bacterium]